jgi:hypothetical protein
MAIVETRVNVRPNTSVLFFTETDQSANSLIASSLYDTGKATVNKSVSSDGLSQTQQHTFVDLAAMTEWYNLNTIELTKKVAAYKTSTGITNPLPFVQTGIDQPFKSTTVYTFPEGVSITTDISSTSMYELDLQMALEALNDKITGLAATGQTVTATHQYNNSEDYSANRFMDFFIIDPLYRLGVTKSVTFELV